MDSNPGPLVSEATVLWGFIFLWATIFCSLWYLFLMENLFCQWDSNPGYSDESCPRGSLMQCLKSISSSFRHKRVNCLDFDCCFSEMNVLEVCDAVWPDDGIQSSPIFSKVDQKYFPGSFNFFTWRQKSSDFSATFVRKFVTQNFQK